MLNETEKRNVQKNIKSKGMTVPGWARSRGFNVQTAKNVIYRNSGGGSKSAEIENRIRYEGLDKVSKKN